MLMICTLSKFSIAQMKSSASLLFSYSERLITQKMAMGD